MKSGSSSASPSRLGASVAMLVPVWLAAEIYLVVEHVRLLHAVTTGGLLRPEPLLAVVVIGTLLLLPTLAIVRERSRPRRSSGRGRLLLVAASSLVHGLANVGAATIVASSDLKLLREAGLGLALTEQAHAQLALAGLASIASAASALGAAVASFYLLPVQVRARMWAALDVVLLVLVAFAVFALPSRPVSGDLSALREPLLRHALTTLGLLRLLVRALPFALDVIERSGLMSLVASRHLRSKKSGFLAAISLLSVLAVTVSCMALTTTLSVMGGFRNDLKRKILGNNAHIVIDREHGSIDQWESLLSMARSVRHVTGAAPFVTGEVMLSSASNLATAVLRGIDPAQIGQVNDLPKNLRSGKLEYLTDPKLLRDAPPSLFRSPIAPGAALRVLEGEPAVTDAGVAEGADGSVADPASGPATGERATTEAAREIEKKLDELEAFLHDPKPPRVDASSEHALPGIVIGQELARALRLYVGDEVNVVSPLGSLGPTGPMPKARPFRVAGIFYSGMYEYDMKFTYVALETAQSFLNVGDAISGIEVRVDDLERAPDAAAALRGKLGRPELRTRDWQELNSRLFGALALEKLAMFIALGIAILVASFCIAGTLTLMVQEKGREVAILKAMGTSDRAIVGVFVIEGGLIGVLGAALGLLLGFMLCFGAEHFGIRMNPEVYYMDRLPVHVDPTEFALTGMAAVLVCLVITVYPALLASRLRPVDALRYE